MKKSNLIMIVVTISMFVVLLLGATYAYFASNTSTGNGLDMTITTDDNNIAFAATEGTLSMHVKAEDMLQSQTGNGDVLAAETVGEDNITITLATNTATPIACTYNVYFQWNTNQAYTKTTGATKELTLELNLEDEDGTGSEGTNSFAEEIQISDVVTGTTKTKVVNGAYIVGSSSNSGSQEWVPTVRFYNLNKNQSALAGKTFGGKFTIEDVVCNSFEITSSNSAIAGSLSAAVLSLASDNEYTSSQDDSKYLVKQERVVHEGIILNAGVRYEGKDPNNYVEFNDGEEWRIIGVFEGSTIGLEPGKQYTKIIRANNIGVVDWQTSMDYTNYSNSWVLSYVNFYLNNEYLESLTDANKIAQYNGNYSTWFIRSVNYDQGILATSAEWYVIERLTGTTAAYGSAPATAQSAIAILSASDYGYGSYGNDCPGGNAVSNYGYWVEPVGPVPGCSQYDWLRPTAWEFTINSNLEESVYYLNSESGGLSIDGANSKVVRPALYLEHNVMIAGGNGSKANPYKLS